jgi:hypothetical protein
MIQEFLLFQNFSNSFKSFELATRPSTGVKYSTPVSVVYTQDVADISRIRLSYSLSIARGSSANGANVLGKSYQYPDSTLFPCKIYTRWHSRETVCYASRYPKRALTNRAMLTKVQRLIHLVYAFIHCKHPQRC